MVVLDIAEELLVISVQNGLVCKHLSLNGEEYSENNKGIKEKIET